MSFRKRAMPQKPKASAKSPPKTSKSYPNPLPPSLQSYPPTTPSNSRTSSYSSYDAQLADWTAKNARAKAIIMSTLVPGSEPWQIAEPLEYAADIWKALEKKYGPNNGGRDDNANEVVHEETGEQTTARGWQDQLTGCQPATSQDGLAEEVSDGLQGVAELWTRGEDRSVAGSIAVNTQAIEEQRKWKNDSVRDQRFLWALLNGGKEEEVARPTGTKDYALGAAG